jgi:hypothetical protein
MTNGIQSTTCGSRHLRHSVTFLPKISLRHHFDDVSDTLWWYSRHGMDILENILPRVCVISPKARNAAGDIAQPRGSIFPIYPCHAHYITIGQCTHLTVLKTFVTAKRCIFSVQLTRYQRISCSTHCSDLFFT